MSNARPSVLGLILWPSLITLVISILRLVSQLQGWTTTQSGGGLAWLGISWLPFVFGAWFAMRLARAGDHPQRHPSTVFALVLFFGLVGAVVSQFGGIDRTDLSEEAFQSLRRGVLTIVAIAVPLCAAALLVWRRLALALLLYGVGARLTVIVLTYLAKNAGWDTHYTKFGPPGFERPMAETMLSASIAQMGFWVPFTVIAGLVFGCVVAGRRPRRD